MTTVQHKLPTKAEAFGRYQALLKASSPVKRTAAQQREIEQAREVALTVRFLEEGRPNGR